MINFIKKHKDILFVPIILISIFLTWFVYLLSSYINDNIKSDSISLTFDDDKISYDSMLTTTDRGFFYDLVFNATSNDRWYQNLSFEYEVGNVTYSDSIVSQFTSSSFYNVFDNDYATISQDKVFDIIHTYLNNMYDYDISYSDINYCYYSMYIDGFNQFNNNDLSMAYQVYTPVYVTASNYATDYSPFFQAEYVLQSWLSSGSTHLEWGIVGGDYKNIDTSFVLNSGLYFSFTFDNVIRHYLTSDRREGASYTFNYSFYSFYEYNEMISTLNSTINDLKSQILSLNASNNNSIMLINNLESQVASLQNYIDYLESNTISDNDTINYLNSQIDVLNQEISILRNQLQNNNAEFSFTRLLWTIGSLPLESFKTMYNVSFLGVNLSEVFLGIVFLGLIIFLFRKFFGMFFHL